MTLANHVPQRITGCYHVTHPWPLNISWCQKDQFLPAVQNIMHNLQVNSSYAIKNGGSNSLRYVKHNTITWTVGVFSLIFCILMKNLDKKQKFHRQNRVDCPFLMVLRLSLNMSWQEMRAATNIVSLLKRELFQWYAVAYDHVGLYLHISSTCLDTAVYV